MRRKPVRRAARWALQDAKNKFSEIVDAAVHGYPQLVTRRGIETVVVISHRDYERLAAPHKTRRSFAKYLLGVPKSDQPVLSRIQLTPRDF